MADLDKDALDRHITGNYGEDQFREDWDDDVEPCQVSNCDEDADDGVLCTMHQVQADEAEMDSVVERNKCHWCDMSLAECNMRIGLQMPPCCANCEHNGVDNQEEMPR